MSRPGITLYEDSRAIVLEPGDELHLRWVARAMNYSSEILLEVSVAGANGERTVVHWSGNPPYERYIQDDYQAEFLEIGRGGSYRVRLSARAVRRARADEDVAAAATVCWHVGGGAAEARYARDSRLTHDRQRPHRSHARWGLFWVHGGWR